MREGGNGKKDRNNYIWVLTLDDSPNFNNKIDKSKSTGLIEYESGRRKGSGALWKLED